jgi:hypothetical protein
MPENLPRAGIYASRAINQYRGRDIFSYLGLRYCLDNYAPRQDSWTENSAIQVVLASPKGKYLRSYHFKGLKDGAPDHRELMVPGPSEALAEATLLANCRSGWENEGFERLFSYHLVQPGERSGYYVRYMEGLRERQAKISKACAESPAATVVYVDIQKFYPSIRPEVALAAWLGFCNRNDIEPKDKILGDKLITNYSNETGGDSILTGPMFSHFLANLVLKFVDDAANSFPASYFRYVDDITLVGSEPQIADTLRLIKELLATVGLKVHESDPRKTIRVSGSEWLTSASDFADGPESTGWMKLVGNIKKLLIFYPERALEFEEALVGAGYRFPMPDYSLARREMGVFEKVRRLGLWNWLFWRTGPVTIENVIRDASALRDRMEKETASLFKAFPDQSLFQQKRTLSKLRYRLGRLAYLSPLPVLERLSAEARTIPELTFHSSLMSAIVTRDCFEVVSLGTNVSQAAAQIFRAMGETANFSQPLLSEAQHQGVAVFLINGVSLNVTVRSEDHPIVRLALGEIDDDLMRQPRGFVQEVACLHGLGPSRHAQIMKTAFDFDQDIALDALEFDYGYSL